MGMPQRWGPGGGGGPLKITIKNNVNRSGVGRKDRRFLPSPLEHALVSLDLGRKLREILGAAVDVQPDSVAEPRAAASLQETSAALNVCAKLLSRAPGARGG